MHMRRSPVTTLHRLFVTLSYLNSFAMPKYYIDIDTKYHDLKLIDLTILSNLNH